jgi:beta-phosphoglucomutase-like phosphatase (HAD superfamily)
LDFTDTHYQQFVGVPTKDCFEIARAIFPADFVWDNFFETLRANMLKNFADGVPFKLGFEGFFAHIKTLAIPIGLVTSAQLHGTELSFKKSGYLSDFDTVVTVEDVEAPKPAPEPYLLACKHLQVEPSHTLVFEDSNVGLASAINAGCMAVAIPDLIAIDEVIKNQCFAVLDNFEQAYQLL